MERDRARRPATGSADAARRADSRRDRLQWRHCRRTPHHAGPRRIGLLRLDSRRRAGRAELWIWTDVDGIMTRRSAPRAGRHGARRNHLRGSRGTGLRRRQSAASAHARAAGRTRIPVWSKNSFAPEKPGTRIVPKLAAGNAGARAVTSMANVALVSLEPASAAICGRAVDGAGARRAGPQPTSKSWPSPAPATGRVSASWSASDELETALKRSKPRSRSNSRTATSTPRSGHRSGAAGGGRRRHARHSRASPDASSPRFRGRT